MSCSGCTVGDKKKCRSPGIKVEKYDEKLSLDWLLCKDLIKGDYSVKASPPPQKKSPWFSIENRWRFSQQKYIYHNHDQVKSRWQRGVP